MIQSVALQLVAAGLAHVLSDVLQPASQTVVNGTLYTAYLGLYTAGPAWGPNNSLSQFTEANYTGYARQKIAWGDEGIDTNQRPEVQGGALQYQPTAAGTSNTIIGVMLCDAVAAGNLLAQGILTGSKVLSQVTDLLTIIPRFAIPGNIVPVDWGEIVASY